MKKYYEFHCILTKFNHRKFPYMSRPGFPPFIRIIALSIVIFLAATGCGNNSGDNAKPETKADTSANAVNEAGSEEPLADAESLLKNMNWIK